MIVVRDDFFITVSLRKNKVIEDFEKRKIKTFKHIKIKIHISNIIPKFFILSNTSKTNK